MADYDVIIIGAGLGGLTSGSILSRQGRRVLVLEQSDRIGGACASYEKDGFTFDIGACIVEVMEPIEMAFRMLGTTLQDEVELVSCDPIYSFVFQDGSRLSVPLSFDGAAEVVERIAPGETANWRRFVEYFGDFYDQVIDSFFVNPANTMTDLLKMFAARPRILKYLPLFGGNYEDVVRKFFSDEKVQQITGYQACYMGLPPERTSGIFAMLVYAEHLGMFYPRGGMMQIPEAFRRLGEKHGMEVRTDTLVKKVLVEDRRARGVVLDDGTEITSDLVVSNVNARQLYLDMIGEEHLPWLARYGIKSYKLSHSDCMLNLGLDYGPPLDAHFSAMAAPMEVMNEKNKETENGILHDDKLGLICWTTLSDPAMAPEGKHTLNIVMEGPYDLRGTDWDKEKEPCKERAIAFFDKVIPGLADHVQVAELLTPYDFERRLLYPGGAIYDLELDLTQSATFRPAARSKSIKGLYLAGNSTHPGGGVPVVIGSGIICADLIDRYE
ncbi:MAG: NAD(P)/FAD-dependent oxidoreductase [Actinomycetota bacterium]|nr:NAD(P)/FAD-dependent oxidoreductase [Actinomycetota bacterium]MDD5668205.1 NAD(P)/FAD-dependent oxidoreductase [Actinomycetota bacterium]